MLIVCLFLLSEQNRRRRWMLQAITYSPREESLIYKICDDDLHCVLEQNKIGRNIIIFLLLPRFARVSAKTNNRIYRIYTISQKNVSREHSGAQKRAKTRQKEAKTSKKCSKSLQKVFCSPPSVPK